MVLPQAMAWAQYWFRVLSLKFCGKSKKICGDISPQSPAFCMYGWWWWLWSLTKDVDDDIDYYKEEEWGTDVNMWWSISDKDDDLAKWKKIMCDPINVCTFSSAASWLQSLINLQLFFFVIVVLLLIWWWRGWWGWRLLEIVTASKCWYHDWHQNGQASTPLWPGERRSTFLQAIGFLLFVSF